MSRILVVDDDRDFSRSLQIQLQLEGHVVTTANTGDDGVAAARADAPDLILLDLKLRETDGLDVMARLKTAGVASPVVMITGEQDMQANIRAVQDGVLDYLRKPFSLDTVLHIIHALGRRPADHDEVVPLRQVSANTREIVGAAPSVLELIRQIGLLSRSRVSVLIQGESGTGKEVVARALHEAATPAAPFVAVNCTAVVPTLLESELFGHEKGAFTGADRARPGRLALAGEGTLFLDEIGDMPTDLQPKLLRVLQDREFTPVGATAAAAFKARLVCATHRDLEAMVTAGAFREDLYYRLAVTALVLPPLRERPGDISLLTQHLLWRISRNLHRNIRGITATALTHLQDYHWPGNVRELENVLTRAVALTEGDVIGAEDLHLVLAAPGRHENRAHAVAAARPEDVVSLEVVEKRHILCALHATGWNITHAARLLGISRPTLRKKIGDYGLRDAGDTTSAPG